jgi:hypothetical protein
VTAAFETLDTAALHQVVGGHGEGEAGANTDYGRDGNQVVTRSRTDYGLCLEKAERDCNTSTRWGPFGWFSNSRGAAACYQKQSPKCVPLANPGE